MARRKNYFNFNDFNFVDGAVDLFENTIRNAFEFDAFTDDVFEARVLTTPTPIVNEVGAFITADPLKSRKYSFRVRILGPLSPHRFLEDPCKMADGTTTARQDQIFSVIQSHTQVFFYDDGTQARPKIDDVVKIKLAKSGHSFDTRSAKQYLGIVQDAPESATGTSTTPDCSNLEALFETFDFDTLGSPSVGIDAMEALINTFIANSLPEIQLLLPTMNPIGVGSTLRTTEQGRRMIWRMANKRNIFTSITEAQAATEPAEVERLRKLVVATGVKVAPPEDSNHNPAKNGRIAIDLQIVGEPSPSYSALKDAIDTYKKNNSTTSFGYEIDKVLPEKDNGDIYCPADPSDPTKPLDAKSKKCGVVHIELKPLNAISTTAAGVASAAGTPPAGVHGPTVTGSSPT